MSYRLAQAATGAGEFGFVPAFFDAPAGDFAGDGIGIDSSRFNRECRGLGQGIEGYPRSVPILRPVRRRPAPKSGLLGAP